MDSSHMFLHSLRKTRIPHHHLDPTPAVSKDGVTYTDAEFETAILLTGFGKFNIILMIVAVPAGFACMMGTTIMSMVVPAAYRDLKMGLPQRGFLNGITYIGMITTGFLWGFLADTLGRKKIIVIGYFFDGLFVILTAMSQTYEMIILLKFMTGFMIQGPYSVLIAIISEFHSAKYRAKAVMVLGVIYSLTNLTLPLLAWVVLPVNMDYDFFDGKFKLHSWNFYILICSLPSLISCICHSRLPESPKFLMSMGRNNEALEIFKFVYSWNTGKPKHTYPVTSLVQESTHQAGRHGGAVTENRTKTQALKEGWQQIKPLFFPPHLMLFSLICTIQVACMTAMNTLRLWLPQLFTMINDHPNTTASLCEMLNKEVHRHRYPSYNSTQTNSTKFIYINLSIVATTSIVMYIIFGALINTLGKKLILISLGLISGGAAIGLYFSKNSVTTISLASTIISLLSVNNNVVIAVVVEMFPTILRTMTVSLNLMLGRAGSMIGNVCFPFLLYYDCLAPFLFIAILSIISALLVFLLPKTDLKDLE